MRKITIARLAELGIKGDVYPEEWPRPPVVDEESSRGFGWVVFEDIGCFWKLEYEYHPEDWIGTNDLKDYPPEHEMWVTKVRREMRETWVGELA